MIPLEYQYYNKGILLLNEGDYEGAIEFFNKAIQLDNKNAIFYYNKGLCLFYSGNIQDALTQYDKAISLDTEFVSPYINKAVILYGNTQYREALQHIDKAIQIDPFIPEAYFNKGVTLGKFNNNEEAIACFDKAINLNPEYINAYYEKGLTLGHQNMHDKAMECFDKVLELDDSHVGAHYDRGIALKNKREYQNAIKAFLYTIKLDPSKEMECITRINNCLLYELSSKYFNFENAMNNGREIKSEFDNQLLPQGYNHTLKQGESTFLFYKSNLAIYCKAYYDKPLIFNELIEIINLIKKRTPNEFQSLVEYITSIDLLKKFTRRWKNCFEILQELDLGNTKISHRKLAAYQSMYENEEILVILAVIRKLMTKNLLDLELNDKKDYNGNYKKGTLANYISDGLNKYPTLKREFSKAYSSKLRNIIGHNNYEIRADKIIDLEENFFMSSEEFAESFKSMFHLQNTILWLIQMIIIANELPKIIDSGVIAVTFEINSDNKTIDFLVFQLWCFYEYDENMDWLKYINIDFHENNIIFSFSDSTLFDEPINESSSTKGYKDLLELHITDTIKDYKVAKIKVIPISPLIDIQSPTIVIKGEQFQILDEFFEKEVQINYQ